MHLLQQDRLRKDEAGTWARTLERELSALWTNDLQEARRQRSSELSIVGYTDAPVTNARNIHAIFSCCSIKPVRKSLVPIS